MKWAHLDCPPLRKKQLGFLREGDIPGHMAPIIYQDAVKNGRAELLMKVLVHNEWDILSLVALYIRSTDLLLKTDTPGIGHYPYEYREMVCRFEIV